MGTQAKAKTAKPQSGAPEIPLAEWIASGIGLILVLATLGYMSYTAFNQKDAPPDIEVEVLSVAPLRKGYVAQFRATNHGDQSAQDVTILGVHGHGDDAEESEVVIDLLHGHSEKRGGLFFSKQPSPGAVMVRASGYREP